MRAAARSAAVLPLLLAFACSFVQLLHLHVGVPSPLLAQATVVSRSAACGRTTMLSCEPTARTYRGAPQQKGEYDQVARARWRPVGGGGSTIMSTNNKYDEAKDEELRARYTYCCGGSDVRRARARRSAASAGLGSKPPLCVNRCGNCRPCLPIRIPVHPPAAASARRRPQVPSSQQQPSNSSSSRSPNSNSNSASSSSSMTTPPLSNSNVTTTSAATAAHSIIVTSFDYYPEAWRCKCGGRLYNP